MRVKRLIVHDAGVVRGVVLGGAKFSMKSMKNVHGKKCQSDKFFYHEVGVNVSRVA